MSLAIPLLLRVGLRLGKDISTCGKSYTVMEEKIMKRIESFLLNSLDLIALFWTKRLFKF